MVQTRSRGRVATLRHIMGTANTKTVEPTSAMGMNSDYNRSLLEGLDLFHGVNPNDVQELLQKCNRQDVGEDELLLEPGSRNQNVYVVLSGQLHVRIGSPDAAVIASMDVGACASRRGYLLLVFRQIG